MRVLSVENTPFELDAVPDEIDDIRYCVLDASDKHEIDFFFLPLVFLESFDAPAICMNIGNHRLQMPMDWSIMICDDDYSAVEVIPLASLNNRGFRAVCMNPLVGSRLESAEISITNIFQDVKWFFPKLKNGHMLAVPLEDKPNPRCAYFVKELNKVCDLELGDLF
jgi:hypothetical protein